MIPVTTIEYQIPQESDLHKQWIEVGSQLFYIADDKITAKAEFLDLLNLLIDKKVLAPLPKNHLNIQELSDHLQNPENGIFQPEYKERWELIDSEKLQELQDVLNEKFAKLGLIYAEMHEKKITVDHCIVMGATAMRMHARLKQTLQKNLEFNTIFLLGSNRKLTEKELDYLDAVSPDDVKYKNCETETCALRRLFEVSVSQDHPLRNRVVFINTEKIGASRDHTYGKRPTAVTTLGEYIEEAHDPSSIYACIEKPYTRLASQLRWQVWTKGETASLKELKERMRAITIITDHPEKGSENATIILQEIAREVYSLVKNLEYLSSGSH